MNGKAWLLFFWSCIALAAAPPPSLVGARLAEMARTAPDLESFLQTLKLAYPDHFSIYSSVFRSRSLHQATPSQPRIVLTGQFYGGNYDNRSKQFFIAFGNLPSDPRYDIVEAIVWNPLYKRYEFYEYNFSKHSHSERVTTPTSCETCHGYPAKPVWDLYPFWPGVFGSIDDRFDDSRSTGQERREFKDLAQSIRLAHSSPSGRLRFLETKEIGQPWHRPNLEINHSLLETSSPMFAHVIAQQIPADSPIRPLLIAALDYFRLCENDLADFFPADLYPSIQEEVGEIAKEVGKADRAYSADVAKRGKEASGETNEYNDYGSDIDERKLAYAKWILDGATGGKVDLFELSANLSPKTFRVFPPDNLARSFAEEFGLHYYKQSDSSMVESGICEKALATHRSLTADSRGEYRESYRKLLEQFIAFSKKNRTAQFPTFGKCAECHAASSSSGAPYIPFGNRILLTERLKQSQRFRLEILDRVALLPSKGKAKMPPKTPLNAEERNQIRAFVRQAERGL